MGQKKETVIYRHPQGRYEVVEISGTDMFGGTYRYRETRRTPKRDARGLLRDADLCAPAIRLTGAEQAEVGETARRKEKIRYKVNCPAGAREDALGYGGGARRPVTGAERAEICRLWEQGESVRSIAERTGRAAGTVRLILNAEGLRDRRKPPLWTQEERRRMWDMLRRGCTTQQVADALGRTENAIYCERRKGSGG